MTVNSSQQTRTQRDSKRLSVGVSASILGAMTRHVITAKRRDWQLKCCCAAQRAALSIMSVCRAHGCAARLDDEPSWSEVEYDVGMPWVSSERMPQSQVHDLALPCTPQQGSQECMVLWVQMGCRP